jgi:F0F1-type ATP synthase membrane subunit c/vacuolar-type H+-ATPase subunit K
MTMTHHRARVRAVLSVAVALTIALTGNGPGFAQGIRQDASATAVSPQSTFSIAAATAK